MVGIGVESSDMLVQEVFSREIRDRKALARYRGPTGPPDESGQKRHERRPNGWVPSRMPVRCVPVEWAPAIAWVSISPDWQATDRSV
jgi:hypothetical protein